jgi:hypothetical protein
MPSEPPDGSWWLWWLTATSLLKAVFAALNEHSEKVQFKKVESNPAECAVSSATIEVEIDTEIGLMFECPAILLTGGSQRLFTRVINSLISVPHRKTTFVDLEQVRCAVQETSLISPQQMK